MFASAPIEEIEKRTLDQDDINGFFAIYSHCQTARPVVCARLAQ